MRTTVRARPGPLVGAVSVLSLVVAVAGVVLVAASGPTPVDVLGVLVTAVAASLLGLLVLAAQPRHRSGQLLLAAGAGFATAGAAAAMLSLGTPPLSPGTASVALAGLWLSQGVLVVVWVWLLLGLPDGEVGGGWRRQILVVSMLLAPVLATLGFLFAGPGQAPEFPPVDVPPEVAGPMSTGDESAVVGVAVLTAAMLPVLAMIALAIRFLRADQVTRQRLKWVVAAALATVLLNVVVAVVGPSAVAIGVVAQVLPPLGIALAVLRYRLWSVDLIIARGALFVVLWTALSAGFVLVGLAVGRAVGGPEVVVPIALALLVTTALGPVRSRGERWLRDHVFGARPEGYRVVIGFAERIADARGSDQLAQQVAEQVQRCLGVSWAGVWLMLGGPAGHRLWRAALAGEQTLPPERSVIVSDELVREIVQRDAFLVDERVSSPLVPELGGGSAAIAPLDDSRQELVGVIAVGDPHRRRLTAADLALLEVLANESAHALSNIRLEAELRARLSEIELQAAEIDRSRHRLVRAQDEERRRIERDLHDGVQQNLVALATRLRQRATANSGSEDLWEELADQAEEAVFAVQDFGRGVYPAVLVDRGLGPALRAQASRSPADIHVDVEPALARRRFPPDVEATAFFVAMEAMTNALKHAPGASVTVGLTMPETHLLLLEVRDDGRGIAHEASGAATGIQNMTDRTAAIGGSLRVDSRPGAGTWVRMSIPVGLDPVALQRAADDSRR